jgi:hypothetical protein
MRARHQCSLADEPRQAGDQKAAASAMTRRFHIIGREIVQAATRRLAAERAWRYGPTDQVRGLKVHEPEAPWGVWCTVDGGITGARQAWLEAKGPGPKHLATIACFTEPAARHRADDLNRTIPQHNRAARFRYTAKEIAPDG